jgi:transcription elongation factor GreA
VDTNHNLSLKEAATRFLASLSPEERQASHNEVYKFTRWYGWEKPFAELSPPDVASYAERLTLSDADYLSKLERVRSFLVYAKKQGWSKGSLASHLKAKKTKKAPRPGIHRDLPETILLTPERYAELEAELDGLRDKSTQLIEDIRLAAADKDFRENAPLQAAREERGHVEGRLKELEEAVKAATIIEDRKEPGVKSGVGDSIVLKDLASNEELRYRIVDPREVDASKGKISIASPLGKGLIGKKTGDIIEITAPAGRLRYQITGIER